MNIAQECLKPGESIKEITSLNNTVERPGLRYGDEVLLDVDRVTPQFLLGGNSLELKVERGMGILATTNAATGGQTTQMLFPRDEATIEPGTIYAYASLGEGPHDPFVVRDHCDDFDIKNESSLQPVVAGLTLMFVGGPQATRIMLHE